MDELYTSRSLHTLPPENHADIVRMCTAASTRGRRRGRVKLARNVGFLDRAINQALNKVTVPTVGRVIGDVQRIFAGARCDKYVALAIAKKALGYVRTVMAPAWGMIVDACPIEARVYALEVLYANNPAEITLLIGHTAKVSERHVDFLLENATVESICEALPLLYQRSSKGATFRDRLKGTDASGDNKLRFAILDCLDEIAALE
jgi:hypothetical protein